MKHGVERIKRFVLGDPPPPVDPALREMLDDPEWRDEMRGVVFDHGQRQQSLLPPRRSLGERRRTARNNIFSLSVAAGLVATLLMVSDTPEQKQPKPLSQEEFLDLRQEVLTSPETLKALGLCARELQAQNNYDHSIGVTTADTTADYDAVLRLHSQDKIAYNLAKIYDVSCDAQVPTVQVRTETRGMQEVWPGTFVGYDQTLWCVQRLAAVENTQIPPENRLAYVDAGDRVFGSRGRYCPGGK